MPARTERRTSATTHRTWLLEPRRMLATSNGTSDNDMIEISLPSGAFTIVSIHGNGRHDARSVDPDERRRVNMADSKPLAGNFRRSAGPGSLDAHARTETGGNGARELAAELLDELI